MFTLKCYSNTLSLVSTNMCLSCNPNSWIQYITPHNKSLLKSIENLNIESCRTSHFKHPYSAQALWKLHNIYYLIFDWGLIESLKINAGIFNWFDKSRSMQVKTVIQDRWNDQVHRLVKLSQSIFGVSFKGISWSIIKIFMFPSIYYS